MKTKIEFGEYVLLSPYINMLTPVTVMCKEGHVFEETPYELLNGDYVCIECEREQLMKTYGQDRLYA